MVQVGGVKLWGIYLLGPFIPVKDCLNTTAYLGIVADHIQPLKITVYPSSDDYFLQQDNASCHKAQIISNWFLEQDNEFTVLQWPPQSIQKSTFGT